MKTTITASLIATALLIQLPQSAVADSKKWRANNHSDYKVKVFWTATGCGGTSSNCAKSDTVGFVCKHEIIHPDGSDEYKFNDGTSNREKKVCAMEGPGMMNMRSTSDRKTNGIRVTDPKSGIAEWFDD